MVIYNQLQRKIIDTYKAAIQEDPPLFPLAFVVKIVKRVRKNDGDEINKLTVREHGDYHGIQKAHRRVQGVRRNLVFYGFDQMRLLLGSLFEKGKIDETKYATIELRKA